MTGGERLRWALAVVVAIISIVCLAYASRDAWFRSDVWDFLVRREAGSVDSWLRPHAGHLQWVQVGLHRLLYGAAGLDYWPWYHVLPIVGYAGMVFYLWRVLLRRSSDPWIAFVAYVVLLFLGVSAFLSSHSIGLLFSLPALVFVAQKLDEDHEPASLDRWVMVVASVLMVTTSSTGVAALLMCLAALAIGGRWRRWWWCLVPGAIVYGFWYFAYGREDALGSIDWAYLPVLPAGSLRLLGLTAQSVTGFPGPVMAWGVVTLSAVAAGVGWLAWRRRLRVWDLILLGTLAGYLAMVGLVRGAGIQADSSRLRYCLMVALLMTLWLVPRLRFGGRWPSALRLTVVLVIAGWLLGQNIPLRLSWADMIEANSVEARHRIEAVAEVIGAGEPAIDSLSLRGDLGISRAGVLEIADIRRLLAAGWEPRPALEELVEELRAGIRMDRAPRLSGESELAPLNLEAAGEDGCIGLGAGESAAAEVVAGGWLRVIPAAEEESGRVVLTWGDGFGQFGLELGVDRPQRVQLASPVGETWLTVENSTGVRVRLCVVGELPDRAS